MLDNLFAQVPTFDTGTHSRATVDAAELAKQLGPVWFFAVLCFVACILMMLGIGWLIWKFGGKLMDRLEKFLDGIGEASAINASNLTSCNKVCGASAINVSNLCDAGHNFANAVQKIGKEMGADVSEECEKIHDKLRTIMSTK
jgi:hypothetical protein